MARLLRPVVAIAALMLAAGVARAQDIKIAVVGPITGSNAAIGEQMKRGAMMAVQDINAKGGVLGKKLALEVADDACDPKQASRPPTMSSARRSCSSPGITARRRRSRPPRFTKRRTCCRSPRPRPTRRLTDDAFAKGWHNVFRVCGRDDAQGLVAGKYLAEKYKDKNIAIIHDKTAYGKGLADETKKAANDRGAKEVMYEAINQGDKDFSALVSKMKQANIDVIYFGGYQTEAGLIVRQSRDQGLKATLIGGDALVTEEFWKITGPAGEGTMMTFAPDPRKVPAAKAVVDMFTKQNYNPEGYTLYTYAAIQAFAAAAEKAKSTDMEKLSQALHLTAIDTVIGKLTWDKKGDITDPKYVFYVWKAGKYAEM